MASWKDVSIDKRTYGYLTSETVNGGYLNRGSYLYIQYKAKWSYDEGKLNLLSLSSDGDDVTEMLNETNPVKKDADHFYHSRRRSYNRMKKALEIYLSIQDAPVEEANKDYIIYTGYSGGIRTIEEVNGKFTGKRLKSSRGHGLVYNVYEGRAVEATDEKRRLVEELKQIERTYKVQKENFIKAIFDES